jgi:1,5-anhydro-D-fructose reductase (1,5-anhydro-D-mannitol-forming)
MSIGWAMVGLGRHTKGYIAPAISQSRNSRLVAVMSRDAERADAFAKEHGAEAGYTSLEALLDHPGVDALFIASPNAVHAEQTVQAARAGKHVLCEKPMALTVQDCRTMIEECRGNDVRLGVGFHLRHHPGLAEAKRLIADGSIGRPVELVGQWYNGQRGIERVAKREGLMAWWSEPDMVGGGAIMATGTHVLDQVRFLTGQEVVEVTAMADYRGEQLDQAIHVLMRLGDGTIASVTAARLVAASDSRNDIVVYGNKGRVAANGVLATALAGSLDVFTESQTYSRDYTEGDVYQGLIDAFCDSVERGQDPNPSGVDGLRVVELTLAALQAAKEGRTVRLELSNV